MKYLAIIEQDQHGFGAWVPDLPGCVSVGSSANEVLTLIREAIDLHIQAMVMDGESVPPPSSRAALVEVQTT